MRWFGTIVLPLLMTGAACDQGASPGSKHLPVEYRPACSCPETLDIRVTNEGIWVAGNTILKTDDGRIDVGLIDEDDKTIIPLHNLLTKFREIEAKIDSGHASVLVLVEGPVPDQSMAALKSTLDQLGYTYRIRTYRG